MTLVLDASAILAMLLGEPGGERVLDDLDTSVVSVVGLAEVLSKLADRGVATGELPDQLRSAGVRFEAVVEADAADVGRLRLLDSRHVLSLGDRICLALARRLGLAVLTGDRVWAETDYGVDVVLVR